MGFHRTAMRAAFAVSMAALCSRGAGAQQDPAHDAAKQDAPTLRATAVLEYLGSLSKPTASRLLPVAVWDGESYQPGGLYLAQPAPLAVEAGTEYELEVAGEPQGLYNLNAAERMNGSWIGIGKWEPLIAPAKPKLHASRSAPSVVKEVDPNRPRLAKAPPGETSKPNPSKDQSKSQSPGTAGSSPPPVDPERPTLHRRPANEKPNAASETSGSPVTATTDIDPNRPHLRRGEPADLETIDQPSKLEGNPANMRQIVAISDAKKSETHPWVYSWADPGDAQKMQSALELAAQKLIAPPAPATHKTRAAAHRRKPAPQRVPPVFTNEVFKAYELSYGGGSTLIFTAQSGDGGPQTKYVALIAQPDFYGNPRVLFQQVTRGDQLDVTPRMTLVDAADTDGDSRAELIFELTGRTGRQFAIYRVAAGEAEQVFSGSPVP